MSMKFALAVSAAVLIAAPLLAEQPADPFGWLEEIEGAKALDWARAENARTLPVLEGDPRFAQMRAEARSILTSPTRIPTGSIHNGAVYNFWQDDMHVRGVWRRASVASYRTGKPAWETLIDFDQLAKDEGENWINGQVACLSPEYRLCMVEMSRGGSDSSTWREFDTTARAFVKNGFALPEAKSDVAWVDADTLVVGTNWGAGTLTDSGYPRIVKVWRRGKPLAAASTLFEGRKEDVAVRAFVDQDGGAQPFVVRAVSFFEAEHHYAPGLGVPSKLPLPLNSNIEGVLDGRAIFTLREAWNYQGKVYGQGSVVAYDLKLGTAEPVFAANDTQSIETVAVGKTGLVVQYLENVSGKAVRVVRTPQGEWRATPIALPANGVLKIASAGGGTDDAMLSFESLTSPLTLYYASAQRCDRTDLHDASGLRRDGRRRRAAVCDVDGWHEDSVLRDGQEVGARPRQRADGAVRLWRLPRGHAACLLRRPVAAAAWRARGQALGVTRRRARALQHPRRIGVRPAVARCGSARGTGSRSSTTSSRFRKT